MFTKKIIDSDAFLDMPLSTQSLYFHLNMRADDDGFINNPKKIMRMIGASEDDLKVLISKRFILAFDNGVVVVKHWRMHNLLRKDRYTETQYIEEKNMLLLKDNGVYTEGKNNTLDASKNEWQPNGNQMATQYSIGKCSKVEYSVVEVSGNDNQDNGNYNDENVDESVDNSPMEYMGGALGKGVVLLSDAQKDALLEKLGLDAFNHYVERLATFIIKKEAHIGNHYKTILEWYEKDRQV